MTKESQRAELHRTIWRIANDLPLGSFSDNTIDAIVAELEGSSA